VKLILVYLPQMSFRKNVAVLSAVWIILLLCSLTVMSSVVTPFLKSLQTQNMVSYTWAGYVVASDVLFPQPLVTAINGSWIVPEVKPTELNTYSAAWVGIGGQSDKTLIQCGTEHDSINGQPRYSAWYEMLPDYAITIKDFNVSPGDQISASIILLESSTNQWLIQLVNEAKGQSFRQAFVYESSRLSGEWVVERPTVNGAVTAITDFESVTFTNVSAQIADSVGTISAFPSYKIVMEDSSNRNIVTVSQLNQDGSSFTVTGLS
jgi:hypothetical protein